jgi:hypothetical protein
MALNALFVWGKKGGLGRDDVGKNGMGRIVQEMHAKFEFVCSAIVHRKPNLIILFG